MTDQNKRILSKLYLTALCLSIAMAGIATVAAIICQIHDSFAAEKAERCLNKLFDEQYLKKYGEKFTEGPDGVIPNGAFDKMMQLENSEEYINLESAMCEISKYGDNKFISGWAGSFELYQKFFSSDRLFLLMWLAILWMVPALFIGIKKWVIWLLR